MRVNNRFSSKYSVIDSGYVNRYPFPAKLLVLVDVAAENSHNIVAFDNIAQGLCRSPAHGMRDAFVFIPRRAMREDDRTFPLASAFLKHSAQPLALIPGDFGAGCVDENESPLIHINNVIRAAKTVPVKTIVYAEKNFPYVMIAGCMKIWNIDRKSVV